ncbi:DNA-binding response regulator [Vallitalea longa]|uniref:Stage 0 sporulation protein A homolog n=1 Tax=Vallitalea longa TaxID=2936439 RepID=A0A9W5YE10_9FIRM|nr:response regulator [Vallitalea longa]GKX30204.1 DNA-binding response regulator [Vallitalea longa]
MINIFLADDENFVRIGIKSVFDWEENGYSIIGEAGNGEEAIKKILELTPDIVFLDITMPIVDGITVLKKIREKGYEGYVVMLTCHENFEFAQKALKYQANDYILKNNILADNLAEYLKSIDKKYLSKHKNKDDNLSNIKEFRTNFLANILRIGFDEKIDFETIAHRYKLKIKNGDIYLIAVKIENYERIIARYEKNGDNIFINSINNIFTNTLEKYNEFEIVKYSRDLFVVLLTFSKEKSQFNINNYIQDIVNDLSYATKTFLNVEIVMALGCNYKGLENINVTYDKVQRILDQTYFYPNKKIYYHNDKYELDVNDKYLNELKCDLIKGLESNSNNKISKTVKKFIGKITKDNILINVDKFIYVIKNHMQELCGTKKIDIDFDVIHNADELLKVLEEFDDRLNIDIRRPKNYLIVQTLKIIDENYTTNVSLDDIAGSIGVTPSYISRIFSKYMNKTISNYINEKRIEYAKNLIKTTNLKHYQVAEKCGFNSAIHYINMFKKYCDITPNEYRNSST